MNSRVLSQTHMFRHLKLIWFFIKPYRLQYTGIAAVSFLTAITECLILVLLFPLLQSFTGSDAGAQGIPGKIMNIILSWMPFQDKIITSCIFIVAFAFFRFGLRLISDILISSTSGHVMTDLRVKIFNKYAFSELAEVLSQKQGRLIHILSMSPNKVASTLQRVPNALASVVTAGSIIVLLFSINWKLSLCSLGVGGTIYLLINHFFRKRVYNVGRDINRDSGEINVTLNEFISGIKQIVVGNGRKTWIHFHEQLSRKLSNSYVLSNIFLELPKNIMDLLAVVFIVCIIVFLKIKWGDSFADFFPVLGLFFISFLRLIPHLSNIGNAAVLISGNMPDCEVIKEVLDRPERRTCSNPQKVGAIKSGIAFQNISFTHPGRDQLLKSISLKIQKHKVTALVGSSGTGKSTIVNLLLGLLEPDDGAVLIDGMDLREIDLDSWRSRIGFVSQDTFIFHSTIANNITFYNPEYSQADIEKSAKVAMAHDFIMSFPDGYQTIVGERGMKLSGGQQQRIAIARAIIRNPEILVFDEATSSLDPISEAAVQNAIHAVSKGHTTFIISHRLSTVENADNILVLRDGKIVEEGDHETLLKRQSCYWQLHKAVQNS